MGPIVTQELLATNVLSGTVMYAIYRLDLSLRHHVVISLTVYTYDYFLTFTSEVSHVWGRVSKTPVTFLFILARYLPIPAMVWYIYESERTGDYNSLDRGQLAIIYTAVYAAEALMALRTYAIWDRNKMVVILLIVFYVSSIPVSVVVMVLFEHGHIGTLERAKAVPGVGDKVIVAQVEFSPFELSIEKSGFAAAAKKLGVTVVAYSPLCRGLVSGRYRSLADFGPEDMRPSFPRFSEENFPKNMELVDKFASIAKKLNATPSRVALAWILKTPTVGHLSLNYVMLQLNAFSLVIPIPGSRSFERLEDNAKAAELRLSEQDVKEIREFVGNADVAGDRYSTVFASSVVGDCIPLSGWKGE